MFRILISMAMIVMFFVPPAQAGFFKPRTSNELYQVFNRYFMDGSGKGAFSSDIELLNSSYFMQNGQDTAWAKKGDKLRVEATFSDSLFKQNLGYIGSEGVVSWDISLQEGSSFDVPDNFAWTSTLNFMGLPIKRSYSEIDMNNGEDTFLAFAIDDDDLLSVFNKRFGTDYHADVDDVWMIAFEGFNFGRGDYTDLVAVVARPNPVPLPASVFLLSSALGGLAVLRKRRIRKA